MIILMIIPGIVLVRISRLADCCIRVFETVLGTEWLASLVSRSQTAFFLIYWDGNQYIRKKRSGSARL